MSACRSLSRRASFFCFWFVENGGNGSAAAIKAGYKPASAGQMAAYLLRHDVALELIAAQIHRQAPGHEAALRRLMRPSRPPALRQRVAELLCRHAQPSRYLEGGLALDFPQKRRNSAPNTPPTR
jgi:hypothetical protein